MLLFAFAWHLNYSLLMISSILCLLISFWCMYETGYYENDMIAEKYEEQPKLALTYHTHKKMMASSSPWLWSFLFGLAGVALLEKAQGIRYLFDATPIELQIASFHPVVLMSCYWALLLLSTQMLFLDLQQL